MSEKPPTDTSLVYSFLRHHLSETSPEVQEWHRVREERDILIKTGVRRDIYAVAIQQRDRYKHERDEVEQLMRLTAAKACGYDTGDQSLEFLRKEQSPELADISIAIDMRLESLERERDEARERLAKISSRHDIEPGCVECKWCGEDWPCETHRLATDDEGRRDA